MSESGIFKAAVKLPPDERAAFVEKACGDNSPLRAEVESLLRAHDASGGFLGGETSRTPTAAYEAIAERLHMRDMYIFHMRFNPDGKQLAVVGSNLRLQNGEARILDAATGHEILRLVDHTGMVMDVSFSPDGQRVATCSTDRTNRIWDARTGQEILTLRGHTLQVDSIRFLSDGHRLISASPDQTIRLWDATPLPD